MNQRKNISINRYKVSQSGKLSIEKRAYEKFLEKFKNSSMGTQRLGQAFYDYFKLDRLSNQEQLLNLYAKDGEHAKRCILTVFDLT